MNHEDKQPSYSEGEAERMLMKTNLSDSPRFDDLPEFLSPEEFWRYTRIGRSTVYDLLRRNEIPHLRFGRVIRIPKSAVLTAEVK